MTVVLISGFVWPEPHSSAAGTRTMNLIDAFRSRGWRVAFHSPAKESEHSERLRSQEIETVSLPANDSAFDEYVRALRPDVVVFDRFMMEEMFGWRVREAAPEAMRVVDTVDLHFLRRARQKTVEHGVPLDLQTDDSRREIASIYRSDLTLVLSSYEHELLLREFAVPGYLLALVPFGFAAPPGGAAPPSFAERRDFVSIGNFRHPPNWDSARWLKSDIWPLIRARLPEAELHLYGAYPSREAMSLDSSKEGFRVLGPISGPPHCVMKRYRVNLAALRFGAGIKGKLADGWIAGTPVIGTSIASEGMEDGCLPWGGLVADTAVNFADAAVRTYADSGLWRELQAAGSRVLRGMFDPNTNARRLLDALDRVREELPGRRRRNFTGQMLWHHSHQSTVYFSKWIELKNKR